MTGVLPWMATSSSEGTGKCVQVKGLIDTGADVTIFAETDWLKEWSTTKPYIDIKGVGGAQTPLQSVCTLLIEDQKWTLKREKLQQVNLLVNEQLAKGHIVPTDSPWNFPIFTIQKSNGKWRLLQDLRELNIIIEPMGALQAELPSPTMLPSNWPIVIDIKDRFFNIKLNPKDSLRFAFTVPSTNAEEPSHHYCWAVLPQGMKNSPSICQRAVADVLSPIWLQFPEAILYHYMDDILLAAEPKRQLEQVHLSVKAALLTHGLEIAPGKEQLTVPWKYLGFQINNTSIQPQTVSLPTNVHTLNDLQSLLGLINWIRPILGVTTDALQPLFQLLKGEADLTSPRHLTPEALAVLKEINQRLSSCQSKRKFCGLPVIVVVFKGIRQPYAVIGLDVKGKDFLLWEWVFFSSQFSKLITTYPEMLSKVYHKSRLWLWEFLGRDPDVISYVCCSTNPIAN
ncbi:endogenous retrovirus group K member 11 Pol protein-like [Pitangus sulphuratus]|nr:endogenous retrovirus group K member 11 Pol protein-like [Pitangus sulphuratus]